MSATVVWRPSDIRTGPTASGSGTPMAISEAHGELAPLWHAAGGYFGTASKQVGSVDSGERGYWAASSNVPIQDDARNASTKLFG